MAIFPPRLKFPQEHCNASKPECPLRYPGYLQELTCEGHRFTTFVNNERYLGELPYYFFGVHLIIPKYFSKVVVQSKTGAVLDESLPPIGIEINRWFALSLRDPDTGPVWGIWDNQILFDEGMDNCGVSAHSRVKVPPEDRPGKGCPTAIKEKKDKGITIPTEHYSSNIHQLFFKFHNHYYTPIVLSNGQTCYYIFEKKAIIKEWVTKFSAEEEYILAINRPIEYSNVLRVPVTRDVEIICSS